MPPDPANHNRRLNLLETHFEASKTLRRLRAGLSGAYIDSFADELDAHGYAMRALFAMCAPQPISECSLIVADKPSLI